MKQLMLFLFLFVVINGCSDGNFKSYKSYGGKTYDSARSICPAPKGGYFLAGMSNSFKGNTIDGYLIKINERGKEQFAYNYGGSGDDRFYKIIRVKDGLVMCGYSDSDGAGLRERILLKPDITGKFNLNHASAGQAMMKLQACVKPLTGK